MKLGLLFWAKMKPEVDKTAKSESIKSLILEEDVMIEILATFWVDSTSRNIRNMG